MFSKLARKLLIFSKPNLSSSTSTTWSKRKKKALTAIGLFGGTMSVFLFTLDYSVRASELELQAPHLPFYFKGFFNSVDHASVRRGLQVYRQVCSACHSIQYVAFRDLVDVTHTEEEAKAIAEEYMIQDGPNEEGNMFERPGKLSDYFPKPYPNMDAARFANNGSFPPDLTHIVKIKEVNSQDYVFHLLTGYCDVPPGITLRDGQYFNPYFMGGALAMGPPLYDDVIEYEDGTPATRSQLAKDMVEFLTWTSDVYFDERKIKLIETCLFFVVVTPMVWFYKGHKWSSIKSRKWMLWPDTKVVHPGRKEAPPKKT